MNILHKFVLPLAMVAIAGLCSAASEPFATMKYVTNQVNRLDRRIAEIDPSGDTNLIENVAGTVVSNVVTDSYIDGLGFRKGGNEGVATNAVRDIVDSSFVGGAQNVNRVVAAFDGIAGRVSTVESKEFGWDGKQDEIADLATIRSGARAGSTAVQPSAISDMETKTHAKATYQPKGNYLTEHQSLAPVTSYVNQVASNLLTNDFVSLTNSSEFTRAVSSISGKPVIPDKIPLSILTNANGVGLVDLKDVISSTSELGRKWKQSAQKTGDWYSIGYGNGRFIAGSWEGIFYSDDGINWLESSKKDGLALGMTYSNGRFLAAGNGRILYSDNGIDWEESASPDLEWHSVSYGSGRFVAGSESGIWYSKDGIEWNKTSQTNITWYSIGYLNGMFLAGSSGNGIYYSSDGINWNETTQKTGIWYSFAYGNGKFVACSYNGIWYSTDGIRWEQTSVTDGRFNSVSYGSGRFVAGGSIVSGEGGGILYSDDGVNWVRTDVIAGTCLSTVYADGSFVAGFNGSVGEIKGIWISSQTDERTVPVVQRISVNGTLIAPDENNTVDIEIGSGGGFSMATNSVRDIVDSSFAGGTQDVSRVVGSFDNTSNRVANIESRTNVWNAAVGIDGVREAIDSSFVGGMQNVNRVVGSFDNLSNRVVVIEGKSGVDSNEIERIISSVVATSRIDSAHITNPKWIEDDLDAMNRNDNLKKSIGRQAYVKVGTISIAEEGTGISGETNSWIGVGDSYISEKRSESAIAAELSLTGNSQNGQGNVLASADSSGGKILITRQATGTSRSSQVKIGMDGITFSCDGSIVRMFYPTNSSSSGTLLTSRDAYLKSDTYNRDEVDEKIVSLESELKQKISELENAITLLEDEVKTLKLNGQQNEVVNQGE